MATDPTRSIQYHDHPSLFDQDADSLLQRLGNEPPQYEVPYLTVTLDWRIEGGSPARRNAPETKRSQPSADDGGSDRPALTELETELNRLIDAHGPRGAVYDALIASKERILGWLRSDLDPAAQGVYIVAHDPSGVFEATGIGLPLEYSVSLSVEPRIYALVRLLEDFPTYAALLVDQENAELSFVTHGARDRSITLESTGYPRRQSSGGLNQKRYRRRAEERVDAFLRDVVAETEKALTATGVHVLIVAGNDILTTQLAETFADGLQDVSIETIRLDLSVAPHEKIEATLPLAERLERAREADAVARLKNAIGSGNLGVAGAAETLRSLAAGQVRLLVLCDTFSGEGWADYDAQVYGVGDVPTTHPTGGDISRIVAVDLRDELVRLALNTGAEVENVHSAPTVPEEGVPAAGQNALSDASAELTELGGVGAVLRYAVTVE